MNESKKEVMTLSYSVNYVYLTKRWQWGLHCLRHQAVHFLQCRLKRLRVGCVKKID